MSGSLLFRNKGTGQTNQVKSLLFGVSVGYAPGVPVEFASMEYFRED